MAFSFGTWTFLVDVPLSVGESVPPPPPVRTNQENLTPCAPSKDPDQENLRQELLRAGDALFPAGSGTQLRCTHSEINAFLEAISKVNHRSCSPQEHDEDSAAPGKGALLATRPNILVTSVAGFLGVPSLLRRCWFRDVKTQDEDGIDTTVSESRVFMAPRVFVTSPVLELGLALLRDRCEADSDCSLSHFFPDQRSRSSNTLLVDVERVQQARADLWLFDLLRCRVVVEMHFGERVRLRREGPGQGVLATLRDYVSEDNDIAYSATESIFADPLDLDGRGSARTTVPPAPQRDSSAAAGDHTRDSPGEFVVVEARSAGGEELGACYWTVEDDVGHARTTATKSSPSSKTTIAVLRGCGAGVPLQKRCREDAEQERLFQPCARDTQGLERCTAVFEMPGLALAEPLHDAFPASTVESAVARAREAFSRWHLAYSSWKGLQKEWFQARFRKLMADGSCSPIADTARASQSADTANPPFAAVPELLSSAVTEEQLSHFEADFRAHGPAPPTVDNFIEIPVADGRIVAALDQLLRDLQTALPVDELAPGVPVLIAGQGLAHFALSLDRWLSWMPPELSYLVAEKRAHRTPARTWLAQKVERAELLLRPNGVREEDLYPGAFYFVLRALSAGDAEPRGLSGVGGEVPAEVECRVRGNVVARVLDYAAGARCRVRLRGDVGAHASGGG